MLNFPQSQCVWPIVSDVFDVSEVWAAATEICYSAELPASACD